MLQIDAALIHATRFFGRNASYFGLEAARKAMQGDELQARLIADGRGTPMIFMTAFPTEAIRSRVLAAGGLAFLEKPADTDRLVRELERAVASV